MIEAMGGCCKLCGYDRCQDAMDFHHINPNEKEFSFSSVRASPKSLLSLINELKKCALLCSRCHENWAWFLFLLPFIGLFLLLLVLFPVFLVLFFQMILLLYFFFWEALNLLESSC